jgi:glycosyltransferase involved in cell wall biosynthesis
MAFGRVQRPGRQGDKVKLLFAGRLTPNKGIYTLLAALHMPEMRELDYQLTVTSAGSHAEKGYVVHKLLEAHPWVTVVPSRKDSGDMARLMAEHDIVLMPSTNIFWRETFGIVSVEAQHAGCRVVASKTAGLPETDCGALTLVKPDDPQALSKGVAEAVALGPVTAAERAKAVSKFTLNASVDKLLAIIQSNLAKEDVYTQFKRGPLAGRSLEVAPMLRQFGKMTAGKQTDPV